MSESTPAGWYPDPERDGDQRYWDGTQWTEHRASGAPAAPPPAAGGFGAPTGPPGQPAMGGQYGQQPNYGQGGQYGQKIDPWLWQSIVATVLCCLPLGIAGIVMAAQSNSAMTQGDYVTAAAKAKQAKTFTLISVGLGLAAVVVYFLFFAIAVGSGEF